MSCLPLCAFLHCHFSLFYRWRHALGVTFPLLHSLLLSHVTRHPTVTPHSSYVTPPCHPSFHHLVTTSVILRASALSLSSASVNLCLHQTVHQQWCIDLHLRVFTLRKNYWSPASPPQTVCERPVSTFSFHLSLQSYGSNPISEPLFGLT